ncbi:hypothetical protein [Nocardiopsis sp. SBT366]|jgi:hypothetical protein|uniref:hypothetical protein n=1 Tax=Nocardiopsis sp. SBT366 TaxID=1580529 RepID=UPI00066D83BC|nr:hypothetical protein [Nocardiopsis sp. SBT366]
MYPPQPPQGPYSGGQDPYNQGQPGYPGVPQGPPKMPGTAITVRVLMFIGGVCGLLFGGLVLLMGLMAGGDNEFGQAFAEGVQETGVNIDAAEVVAVMAILGGVMFVYGLVSTALASFMGRRSGGILWSIVVFQALAALLLLVNIFTGAIGSFIPLLFAIGMIVLMVVPATRAYYKPAPAGHYPGY